MTTEPRITWRDGFRIDGRPAPIAEIQPIYNERLRTAWERYEQLKFEIVELNLTPDEYRAACMRAAESLGI